MLRALSIDVYDTLTKRRERNHRQTEMREAKRNSDDRQAVSDAGYHVRNPQPDAGKDDPEEIRQACSHNPILTERARVNQRASKRPRCEAGDAKRGKRERDPHDRDGENAPDEQPGDPGHYPAADDEVEEIEKERHGLSGELVSTRWT